MKKYTIKLYGKRPGYSVWWGSGYGNPVDKVITAWENVQDLKIDNGVVRFLGPENKEIIISGVFTIEEQ